MANIDLEDKTGLDFPLEMINKVNLGLKKLNLINNTQFFEGVNAGTGKKDLIAVSLLPFEGSVRANYEKERAYELKTFHDKDNFKGLLYPDIVASSSWGYNSDHETRIGRLLLTYNLSIGGHYVAKSAGYSSFANTMYKVIAVRNGTFLVERLHFNDNGKTSKKDLTTFGDSDISMYKGLLHASDENIEMFNKSIVEQDLGYYESLTANNKSTVGEISNHLKVGRYYKDRHDESRMFVVIYLSGNEIAFINISSFSNFSDGIQYFLNRYSINRMNNMISFMRLDNSDLRNSVGRYVEVTDAKEIELFESVLEYTKCTNYCLNPSRLGSFDDINETLRKREEERESFKVADLDEEYISVGSLETWINGLVEDIGE